MSEEQKEEGANRVISLLVRSGVGIDPLLAKRIRNETDLIFAHGEACALREQLEKMRRSEKDIKSLAQGGHGE